MEVNGKDISQMELDVENIKIEQNNVASSCVGEIKFYPYRRGITFLIVNNIFKGSQDHKSVR